MISCYLQCCISSGYKCACATSVAINKWVTTTTSIVVTASATAIASVIIAVASVVAVARITAIKVHKLFPLDFID